MELETQKYLRKYGLEALKEKCFINYVEHPVLPLLLFKYNAVETRKVGLEKHPITRECRSLVL